MAATDPTSGRVLETPELRERGLQMMRALLEKHADARCVRTDDTFLLPFLRRISTIYKGRTEPSRGSTTYGFRTLA